MPQESIMNSPYPSNLPINAHTRQPSIRASPSTINPTRAPSFTPASAHPTPVASNPTHPTPVATPAASFPAPPSVSTPRDGDTNKRRRLTVQPSTVPAISSNLASNPSTPGIKPEPVGPTRSNTPSVNTKKRKPPPKRELPSDPEDDDEDEDEDEDEAGEDKRPYCMCQQVSYGNMVACDAEDCPFEWFHWGELLLTYSFTSAWTSTRYLIFKLVLTNIRGKACVNLTKEPPGKWFCPSCHGRREKIKTIK